MLTWLSRKLYCWSVKGLELLSPLLRHEKGSSNYMFWFCLFLSQWRCRKKKHSIWSLRLYKFCQNAIFHVTSWLSQKSKRPVRSAAEILAAAEGIDEGKMITDDNTEILNTKVDFNRYRLERPIYVTIYTTKLCWYLHTRRFILF